MKVTDDELYVQTWDYCCDAFEEAGGCGHDLGGGGLLAILKAWEHIRTPARVQMLENRMEGW